MLEGSDVTFAVAIAFLRMVEPAMLRTQDLAELTAVLRARERGMYDADLLLRCTKHELDRIRPRLRPCRAWHLRWASPMRS
jgi:hypothetical protein